MKESPYENNAAGPLCGCMGCAVSGRAKEKPKAPDDMATRAQMCRAMVGREVPEATDGRSHEGQLNVQRFSDCLMGNLPGIGR